MIIKFFDNDLVSEYLDVASDVENMCVDDRGVDIVDLCVVWPPCLAILCYMGGDVGHVVYMCEGGVSLGEVS